MPIMEGQPDEAGSQPVTAEETPKTHRSALDKLTRELTDDDLNSPGARKLLLLLLEEAQGEVAILKPVRDLFHNADKQNAILEEKLKANIAADVIYGATLTIGAAIVGLAPTLWKYEPDGKLCLVCGGLLILVGILAKVILSSRTKAVRK